MNLSLVKLKQGEQGKILDFKGGQSFQDKLLARGIRPGKIVTKISEAFMGGPVTIKVDNCNIALGYRMAARVRVEVDEEVEVK